MTDEVLLAAVLMPIALYAIGALALWFVIYTVVRAALTSTRRSFSSEPAASPVDVTVL